jgi:hypothetical protein
VRDGLRRPRPFDQVSRLAFRECLV